MLNDFGKAFAKNCVSIILHFDVALCNLLETYIDAKNVKYSLHTFANDCFSIMLNYQVAPWSLAFLPLEVQESHNQSTSNIHYKSSDENCCQPQ